ncbi:hypothetical protein AX16_005074 [Volvariella volvacea WC 439]|nr:hypothetical protein AX16_005074 [Volvariella volvacea WC 439]
MLSISVPTTAPGPAAIKPSSLDAFMGSERNEAQDSELTNERVIKLPRVYRSWPWTRRLNPYYEVAKRESNAWIRSFQCLTEKRQVKFEACDFSLASCLLWPNLNRTRTRVACDLMNLYFMIDHFSDIGSGDEVQGYVGMIRDALQNPWKPRPVGEVALGEMTRQFWVNALKTKIPPLAARRFITRFCDYAQGIATRAADRDQQRSRTIEEYLHVRRKTIGVRPSLFLLEVWDMSDADLPTEFVNNPTVEGLINLATDMVILDNDMLSYNIEQARGDDAHNILTIVTRQLNTDIHGALRWVEEYHANCERSFLDNYRRLVPSLQGQRQGERMKAYVDGVGMWAVGHYSWCFESQRYFGKGGLRVREEGVVHLLPPAGPRSH